MTSFKGTNRKPTSSCDVRRRRNMGLPTGREPHGNGVPVVVRGWESQPHGEGEQRMDTQSLEGARDAQSRQATQRGTGKPAREPFLESWMTRKRSCPVRRGGIGKVAEQSGNSLVSYSTSRPVLRGGGRRKAASLPGQPNSSSNDSPSAWVLNQSPQLWPTLRAASDASTTTMPRRPHFPAHP
jgi:hypothetical protein